MRRFDAAPRRTTPKGHKSSISCTATHQESRLPTYDSSLRAWRTNTAFFRRATSGAGREILSGQELAAYHARAAELAPPDMLTWLHTSPAPVNA